MRFVFAFILAYAVLVMFKACSAQSPIITTSYAVELISKNEIDSTGQWAGWAELTPPKNPATIEFIFDKVRGRDNFFMHIHFTGNTIIYHFVELIGTRTQDNVRLTGVIARDNFGGVSYLYMGYRIDRKDEGFVIIEYADYQLFFKIKKLSRT